MNRKRVLAISGSTRQNSTNNSLIRAIVDLSVGDLDITVYNGIANLPHFNPDQDGDTVVSEVADFRRQLSNAEGVIICTPEYAHGVPGSLKNAIDWTVSSAEFYHKPTVLITASTDGSYGHKALLETLKVIEAKDIDKLQLVIPFVKVKISNEGIITDEKTLNQVKTLIHNFMQTMHDRIPG